MSKRHFELIAAVIAGLTMGEGEQLTPQMLRARVAVAFAKALQGENERFDAQRFIEACCNEAKHKAQVRQRAIAREIFAAGGLKGEG